MGSFVKKKDYQQLPLALLIDFGILFPAYPLLWVWERESALCNRANASRNGTDERTS